MTKERSKLLRDVYLEKSLPTMIDVSAFRGVENFVGSIDTLPASKVEMRIAHHVGVEMLLDYGIDETSEAKLLLLESSHALIGNFIEMPRIRKLVELALAIKVEGDTSRIFEYIALMNGIIASNGILSFDLHAYALSLELKTAEPDETDTQVSVNRMFRESVFQAIGKQPKKTRDRIMKQVAELTKKADKDPTKVLK